VFNIYQNLKKQDGSGSFSDNLSKWVMAERIRLTEED
jgi:hypothetical protein